MSNNKPKVSMTEVLDEFCSECKAPGGMACTYVHPRHWSYDNQQRFFNKMPLDRQLLILRRADTYMDRPHHQRYATARATKKAKLIAEGWDRVEQMYHGLQEMDVAPDTRFVIASSSPDVIYCNGLAYRNPEYIDKILADARHEWALEHDKKNGEAYKAGIKRGKEIAIDGIATGIVEGL